MLKQGLLLLAAAAALSAGPALAQTIDQSQQTEAALYVGRTGSDACAQGCGSNGWMTQSFRPAATTSAGAAFYLSPFASTSGTLLIDLWDRLPSAAGAVKLAGGTTALGTVTGYYTVWFSTLATVTAGSQYFLNFYSDAQYNVHANYDVYAGGTFNYNKSTTATTAYVGNQCCDSRFIEYSAGPTATPVVTPEPSSIALVAAGLGVLAAAVRRRNAKCA
ncbi:MAG: PEP-CTERM sorting domain-containing protein [Gemmatimonas sp.]